MYPSRRRPRIANGSSPRQRGSSGNTGLTEPASMPSRRPPASPTVPSTASSDRRRRSSWRPCAWSWTSRTSSGCRAPAAPTNVAPSRAIIDGYLSPRHRNALGKGCAVAALGSDLPRQSKKVRQVFTKRLEEGLEVLAGLVPAKAASRRHDVAIQLFSAMVGAPDPRTRGRRGIAFTTDTRDGGERAQECRPRLMTAPGRRGVYRSRTSWSRPAANYTPACRRDPPRRGSPRTRRGRCSTGTSPGTDEQSEQWGIGRIPGERTIVIRGYVDARAHATRSSGASTPPLPDRDRNRDPAKCAM